MEIVILVKYVFTKSNKRPWFEMWKIPMTSLWPRIRVPSPMSTNRSEIRTGLFHRTQRLFISLLQWSFKHRRIVVSAWKTAACREHARWTALFQTNEDVSCATLRNHCFKRHAHQKRGTKITSKLLMILVHNNVGYNAAVLSLKVFWICYALHVLQYTRMIKKGIHQRDTWGVYDP